MISALNSKGGAEMTTDQGAIYVTDNAAYTWTAAVQETVDATLNRTVSSGKGLLMLWGRAISYNWDGMIFWDNCFFLLLQALAGLLTTKVPSLMLRVTKLGSMLRSAPVGTSS